MPSTIDHQPSTIPFCARAHSLSSISGQSRAPGRISTQVPGCSMKAQGNKEINKTGNGIKQTPATAESAPKINA